ncbi:MAG: hypothetical protein K8R74_01560, partial [Bacteroidales bacterium]|nr:hypothetical protein [Bacteroidales bacterium]
IRSLLFISILGFSLNVSADEELWAYYKVGSLEISMNEAVGQVKEALSSKGFEVIGEYNPENNDGLYVIAYTRDDLQKTVIKVKDRGALASVLKVGLVKKEEKIIVSVLNPSYLFYAYLMDEADAYMNELNIVTNDVKSAMKAVGEDYTGFGGSEEAKDLKDYHYMMMMPYFTDPVELNEFDSFEQGVSTIRKNLNAKKGNTVKVYEVILENEKVAIFGVGLLEPEEGEAHFLPIIGEDNIAAMPYEIILQGKEATMLHGKYRFALHWPKLTMGQFMKISSTPGDVEDFMEALTE